MRRHRNTKKVVRSVKRCAFLLAIGIILSPIASAAVWYVDKDATGAGDGSSWATAFTAIQDGIDSAFNAAGGEVWIAEGVYDEERVSIMHDPPVDTGSVVMKEGVHIYGGFAGTETARTERDWETHVTTIDGSKARGGEPAYHVIVGADNATLDGFAIVGGDANYHPPYPHPVIPMEKDRGGGMYINQGSPLVANCRFSANSAYEGGGIFNANGTPTFANCSFSQNVAFDGGGIASEGPIIVTNCDFEANAADYDAGGIRNAGTSSLVENCTFSGNSARYNGGGISNLASLLKLVNCIFSGNASDGGGGGGIHNRGSSPTVTNCTFWSNSSPAIYPSVGSFGADILNTNFYSPIVTNCILWSDASIGSADNGFSAPIVTYCDIQGGYPGEGNIDADPRFEDAENGDFRLRYDSPCIDAGTASGAPNTDILGLPRPHGAAVDMGAYEFGADTERAFFFDNFNDGVTDPTKWVFNPDAVDGSVAEHDGYLEWTGSGTPPYQAVRTAIDLLRDAVIIKGDIRPVWVAGNKNAGFWLGQIDGYGNYYGHGYAIEFNSTSSYVEVKKITGTIGGNVGRVDGIAMDQWYGFEVVKNGSSISFFIVVDGDKILIGTDDAFSLDSLYWSTGRAWNENRGGENAIVRYDDVGAYEFGEQLPGSVVYTSDRLGSVVTIETMDADGGPSVPIVNEPSFGTIVTTSRVSDDGTKVVFCAGQTHGTDVWIVNSDGTGLRNVTNNAMGAVWCDLSPDGTTILFCTIRYDLYTINADGTNLTHIGRGVHPRWSPDGTEIIYSNWGITYDSDLLVMDMDTMGITQVTNTPGVAEIVAEWSPDKVQILFDAVVAHNQPDENQDVWVMDADGSNRTNLSGSWGASSGETFPVWSRDGNYIAFMSNISGNSDIWIMRADGSNKQNITNTEWNETHVSWSPLPCTAPRLVSVTPSGASPGDTLDVDVVGAYTDFDVTSEVDFGPGVLINDVVVATTMELSANLFISWDATPGPRDVSVTTGSEVAVGKNMFAILGQEYVPAPTGLTATAGASSIFLEWRPSFAPQVTGYNPYRDVAIDGSYSTRLTDFPVARTWYEDTAVTRGETYYYKVTAVTGDGSESEKSAPAWATVGGIVLTMPDIRGNAGESVRLPINLDCAWDVNGSGMEIHVTYDKTLLTPTAVEKTVLTQEFTFVDNVGANPDGQIGIAGLGEGTLVGEGHILDILFDVNPDAQLGDTGTFVLVDVVMYDWNLTLLDVDYSDTAIFTVSPYYTLGDVSGDAVVDVADAILAQRIATGEIEPTELQLAAGDINGDGVIDSADVTLILRMVLGLPINPEPDGGAAFPAQAILLAQAAASSYTVSITNASGDLEGTVPVAVRISDAAGVAGCDLTISFDPTAFEVTDVALSALTENFSLEWYESAGVLDISLASSVAINSGPGELCIIHFYVLPTAITGETVINLASVKLSGEHGEDLAWSSPVSKSSGAFTVRVAGGGGGGSSGACFIATAAYGTPMAEQVCVLRDFRDRYLLTNRAGAACVRAYYRFSPSVARFIARHEPVRKVVRTVLSPIIVLARFGLGWRTAAMPLSIVVLCAFVFAVRGLTVRKRASC